MRYTRSLEFQERFDHAAPAPSTSPFPLYYDRGNKSHIWDADGNSISIISSGWVPFFSATIHHTSSTRSPIKSGKGCSIAHRPVLMSCFPEKICELVPFAERVRFTSSGSEGVHGALRLARGITGRRRSFALRGITTDGSTTSHGNCLLRIREKAREFPHPSNRRRLSVNRKRMGPTCSSFIGMISMGSPSCSSSHGDDIARIILDPLMTSHGVIPPQPGFLQTLRNLCDRYEAVLIFDEVVTGFRLALGGASGILLV
ncbi:MAG: aminotransferase class III-fold pyridoxal phosphate-dependent enzyme [Candidatus Omnitrophica bacterium]|nr:aminotransferase class III-fold pyridoxal phosphate-dependent enzyme [Candidatus Omnitrophota bacterium]